MKKKLKTFQKMKHYHQVSIRYFHFHNVKGGEVQISRKCFIIYEKIVLFHSRCSARQNNIPISFYLPIYTHIERLANIFICKINLPFALFSLF